MILPWETREKGLERQITAPLNISLILWGIILSSVLYSLIGVLVSAPPTDQLSDIMTLANLIKFPLIFISGVFIPLNQLSSTG